MNLHFHQFSRVCWSSLCLLGCAPEEIDVVVESELAYCVNVHEPEINQRFTASTGFARNLQVTVAPGRFRVPLEDETREPAIAASVDAPIELTLDYPHREPSKFGELSEVPMTALSETNLFLGHDEGATTVTTAELAPIYQGDQREGWLRLKWEVSSRTTTARLRHYRDVDGAIRVSVFTHNETLSQCDLDGFPRVRRTLQTERGDVIFSWRFADRPFVQPHIVVDQASLTTAVGEFFEQSEWKMITADNGLLSGGFLLEASVDGVCGFWFENMDNPLGMSPGPAAKGYELACGTMAQVNPFEILSYEDEFLGDG